jgi:hypothetical protein
MENVSLQDYQNALKQYLAEKSDFIFKNSGINHALAFTGTIFETAIDLKMISHGLGKDLASKPEYVDKLRSFLEKENTKLSIAIESKEYWDGEALKLIRQAAIKNPERFQIRLIPQNIIDTTVERSGTFPNLMLADNCIFRFETVPSEYKAYGSFNRKEVYDKLYPFFKVVFDNSEKLKPDLN